jgi:kynurenine formamidase
MRFPSNHQLSYYELSHAIEDGMVTYQGLPPPKISEHWSREFSKQYYQEGTSFHIGKIEMVANTGTYIDCPFHRYENGDDLSELDIRSFANLEGIVIRVDYKSGREIDEDKFLDLDLNGKAVLINTNWDKFWGTEKYFKGHPFITRKAAHHITQCKASLVGIDSLNIDEIKDGSRPAHSILLGANIPIVEHLRGLERIPDEEFRFYAVPVRVKQFGSFPVRAFAVAIQGSRNPNG